MRYRTILIILLMISPALIVRAAAQQNPINRQVERTIVVEPDVRVSLCLGSGSITVRGWDRNEVRIRTSDTTRIDFQRRGTDNPGWSRELALVNPITGSKCVAFGDIELDVPREAGIDLQADNARVQAAGMARVKITNRGGSIEVEQVSHTIDINTIGGHISIRNSRGSITLRSASGPIEVRDVKPNLAGESFQATAVGGEITLERVGHTLVKASSVNGALNFAGPLVWAGRYNFQTVLGNVKLSLPPDASFRVSATLSRDIKISSDFALQSSSIPLGSANILDKRGSNMMHLDAAHGTADIQITLASFSGHIYLLKK